jgi:hypothetical protein
MNRAGHYPVRVVSRHFGSGSAGSGSWNGLLNVDQAVPFRLPAVYPTKTARRMRPSELQPLRQ